MSLKIYEQNQGWAGNLVVVAESEAEARELMTGHENYNAQDDLICHEIKKGLVIFNYGDL
jgi:hypothetical protein